MDDLISRSALLEELKEQHDYIMQDQEIGKTMKWREAVCFHRTVEAVENAPAVDAETVFQQLGLMQEALDMAKSTLAPVVRCKDCKHFRDWGDGNITCHLWTDEWDAATVPDAFCSYGERRMVTDKIEIEVVDIPRGDLKADGGHPDPTGALGEQGVDGIDVLENGSADDA